MIRRVLSVGFYIVAGLLFYTVSVVAFIDVAALDASSAASDASDASFPKWLPMIIFGVPAILTLIVGLAIMGFQEWKRDAGIVLLSAAGFMTFLVFMFATMLMKEDSRKMMPPEVLSFFGDYITGAGVIVGLALGGALLLIMSRKSRTIA
jgi:hypothetical protein